VNIVGALILGWLITRLQERLPPTMYTRALLATGFCGALTTFSTLMLELLAMIEHSHLLLALSYAAASIIGGLAAVELATKFARRGGRLG
jgi:CrcB protein